jgi:hypothetical protein
MLKGQVVHRVIANSLRTVADGGNFNPEAAKASITDLIRKPYMESQRGWWDINRRPEGIKASQVTSLFEHYYKVVDAEVMNQRARDARDHAEASLDTLFASDFWNELIMDTGRK